MLKFWSRVVLVITTAAALSSAATAGAAPGQGPVPGVVLESYVGKRSAGAGSLLAPLQDELEARGFLTRSRLAERIHDRVSRSGASLTTAELDEVRKLVESGENAYYQGEFTPAASDMARAWEIFQRAPAHRARDQALRLFHRRALVVLAESQRQLRRADEATRAMAELIRSYPDRPLTTLEYSPDIIKFYRQVGKSLRKQGMGTLEITVDDPVAVVFLDEAYAGSGTITRELYPGRYRVYVQKGEQAGRVHEVDVNPGATTRLGISWDVDAALETASSHAALIFADGQARQESEAKIAIEVARKVGAQAVVVAGIRTFGEQRQLVGAVLSLDTGETLRSARLALEPVAPSPARIRELARFLAGDENAGPFEPVPVNDVELFGHVLPRDEGSERWYQDGLGWGLTGAGIVAAGIATGLFVNAGELEDDSDRELDVKTRLELREKVDSRRTMGVVAGIAGGALIAAGITKLVLVPGQEAGDQPALALTWSPGWLALQGRF